MCFTLIKALPSIFMLEYKILVNHFFQSQETEKNAKLKTNHYSTSSHSVVMFHINDIHTLINI